MPDEKRDIVERLRNLASPAAAFESATRACLTEAAATIELLRAEVRILRKVEGYVDWGNMDEGVDDMEAATSARHTTDAAHALGKESPNANGSV